MCSIDGDADGAEFVGCICAASTAMLMEQRTREPVPRGKIRHGGSGEGRQEGANRVKLILPRLLLFLPEMGCCQLVRHVDCFRLPALRLKVEHWPHTAIDSDLAFHVLDGVEQLLSSHLQHPATVRPNSTSSHCWRRCHA
jgi:hypothetical protein